MNRPIDEEEKKLVNKVRINVCVRGHSLNGRAGSQYLEMYTNIQQMFLFKAKCKRGTVFKLEYSLYCYVQVYLNGSTGATGMEVESAG